jgi:17beta-estradiol 17-dehydrogenase / very-long-chain 3-oxoacyl-CoA reductase
LDFISPHLFRKMNSDAALRMSRLVLPNMISKKKGVILNVGSLASRVNLFLTPYASDKARLNSITISMNLEYRDNGIQVGCALGGKISSPSAEGLFSSTSKKVYNQPHFVSVDVVTPENFAENSLKFFGYDIIYVPCWIHAFQLSMVNSLPDFLVLPGLFAEFKQLQKEYGKLKKGE